ncbi:MAG TPA: hypothetical protein VFM93_07030 [Candidatus Limnocylindria bacterium]|nr:hypothetical protein [Candidatus Limnocylindria bacterium]
MIRFVVAVGAGALLTYLALDRSRATQPPAVLVLAFLAVVALGVGFLAARRTWLAPVLAVYAGVVSWFLIGLRASPPWAASDVWGGYQWLTNLVSFIPIAIGSALFGGVGGWIRGRLIRR